VVAINDLVSQELLRRAIEASPDHSSWPGSTQIWGESNTKNSNIWEHFLAQEVQKMGRVFKFCLCGVVIFLRDPGLLGSWYTWRPVL